MVPTKYNVNTTIGAKTLAATPSFDPSNADSDDTNTVFVSELKLEYSSLYCSYDGWSHINLFISNLNLSANLSP